MAGAVVLAAGMSTRMGRQKLLLPFAASTVIGHVVAELQRSAVRDVHVVIGHDAAEVCAALEGSGAVCVENPDYETGMLSSVRAGLRSAPAAWTAALIALGDQPLLRSHTVDALLEIHRESRDQIVVPTYEGRRGHPLVLPRRYWDDVLTLFDDVGLRGVLHAHAAAVREVALDTATLLTDMDYPEDYRRALETFEPEAEA